MVTVTISEKGGQQSQYEFNKSAITIGRMKGNDIVLPKGNVSKKHSRISANDGNVSITDLNSTNGTYVNGRKVTGEQPITENDKIYIGDFILQVETPQQASQSPAGPPQPPQQSQGGFGGGSGGSGGAGGGSMPPSPPADSDQGGMRQPSGSGLGGGGPVDDLFAAGDSAGGPGAQQSQQQRHSSSAGGATPRPQNQGAASSSPPSPARDSAAPAQGGAPEPSLDFDDFGFDEPARDERSPSSPGASSAPPQPKATPTPTPDPSPSPSSSAAGLGTSSSSDPAPAASERGGRLSREVGPGSAFPQGGALVGGQKIRSEYDPDFHAAQIDVARVLFESVSFDDLPIDYPPAPEARDEFQSQVEDAVDKVNPMVDRETLVDVVTTECVGLGPIELYLDDPEVQDFYVNRFDQILVRKDGEMVVAERAFSHPDFLSIAAHRLLGTRDETIGADEVRFSDGTRVHIVMPPLSVDGPALTVRKPPTEHPSLDDLVSRGVMSQGMREFLEWTVQAGRSVLVAGPTSSGKSTLLGAIAREIPSGTRIITVEESTHLDLPQDSVVRLEASPAAGRDLKFLVRTAVAMHPQRIILDECRGGEAYEWVTSAASGTEGSMVTSHGSSASDALGRLESLCLLGNPEISPRGLREQIARAVDFVVVAHRTGDNTFRVRQVTEVQGVDLDAFRLNDVFYYRVEGSEEQFHPTGYIPLFYEDLRHAGVEVDFDIFRE